MPAPLDEDFIKSRIMGVTTTSSDGTPKVVAAINLSGISVAISKLKMCALQAAGLNPKDPFLD